MHSVLHLHVYAFVTYTARTWIGFEPGGCAAAAAAAAPTAATAAALRPAASMNGSRVVVACMCVPLLTYLRLIALLVLQISWLRSTHSLSRARIHAHRVQGGVGSRSTVDSDF